MMKESSVGSALRAAVAVVAAGVFPALGQAVIDNGTVQLGVDLYGQLNVSGPPSSGGVNVVGLRLLPGYESTSPGCLCEGWGVGYVLPTLASGSANNALGVYGLSSVSYSSTASSALSVVSMGGLKVTHSFNPSLATPYLYQVDVTIENLSGGTVQDVRYTRTMDWDIEPTAFSEYVTIQGTGTTTALLYSSDNGFLSPDPFASRNEIVFGTTDVDFVDAGPADHGAHFDFGFGDLLDGGSYTFQIFYGAAPTEASALGAVGAAGLELFSLGQSNGGEVTGEPATHIFGFKGVGGEVQIDVPEGDTAIAAGLVGAFAGAAYFRRKRA